MKHSAASGRKRPWIPVLVFCSMAPLAFTQSQPKTHRGTVNIALANAKGIVLLTDSVESIGGVPRPEPAQKLFRLDDKTVCSFAGFASETGWTAPLLNTEVSGIIEDFRDQLSSKPVPELEAKLRALGFLVGFYIDLVSNRYDVLRGTAKPGDYVFQLMVAGYDADGSAKIEKLVLTPEILVQPDGHRIWSSTMSPVEVSEVGHKFVRQLNGIEDVSKAVLDHPEAFDNEAVRKYARSMKQNGGESLTLDEMAALASYMAAQTAKRTKLVGPPDQIATLSNSRILSIKQPPFADAPRPMKAGVFINLKETGGEKLIPGNGVHFIYIRDEFDGVVSPRLQLDGQFFYGCEIRDSILEYSGGLTDFGPTNRVTNTVVLPGPGPVVSTTSILRLMNAFKWSPQFPSAPRLPTTMGPR
jgi:hypothetical protein